MATSWAHHLCHPWDGVGDKERSGESSHGAIVRSLAFIPRGRGVAALGRREELGPSPIEDPASL